MAKKRNSESQPQVTRSELSDQLLLDRIQSDSLRRAEKGAIGALSFEQVLALTHKKKAQRIDWRELELWLLELVKSGELLTIGGQYYRKPADISRELTRARPLEVPSSAHTVTKKRTDKQLEMFEE